MIIIDDTSIDFIHGETVMQVADRLGIEIPRMCHRDDLKTFTSCMVCQVLDRTSGTMIPACSIPAASGMAIETSGDRVEKARRTAVELLLSEHLGDCEGPCRVFCPAGMDIPLMIRQIAAGQFASALETVKADIALPAVLGRVCSAPCENACRRSFVDGAVGICALKRFVADLDLATETPWLPEVRPATGKRIAVVGGGPMGLAAAWHLCADGHGVTVFDAEDTLGGGLRSPMRDGHLDAETLDREIAVVLSLGAEFKASVRLGDDLSLGDLLATYDAVLIGFQPESVEVAEVLGLPTDARGVAADKRSFSTTVSGLFARPGVSTGSKMSVRAVGAGKAMARSVTAFLGGDLVHGSSFNSVFGKPETGDLDRYMATASNASRHESQDGLSTEDAVEESLRCLHCDCRSKDACALRDLATSTGAKQKRFSAEDRHDFELVEPIAGVVYEPGKCIRCGICVRICESSGVGDGFTFLNRGYDVRVGTPFGRPISEMHREVVLRCVRECPTGALATTG